MNKNQVTKRAYIAPLIEVCAVKIESPMLVNSPVGGGHNDAEDEGPLEAKQFHFDEEDGIWQNSHNLWDD